MAATRLHQNGRTKSAIAHKTKKVTQKIFRSTGFSLACAEQQ